MNRNQEVKSILRSREIAERERQEQRRAARIRKQLGRSGLLEFGYCRDSSFPSKFK